MGNNSLLNLSVNSIDSVQILFVFDFLQAKDLEQVVLESDALERDYHTYFDLTLIAEDIDKTFEQ